MTIASCGCRKRVPPGKVKLGLQAIITVAVVAPFSDRTHMTRASALPRRLPLLDLNKYPLEMFAPVYYVLAVLVILGANHAVSLTDGLDGLAIGPVIVSAGTFLILMSHGAGHHHQGLLTSPSTSRFRYTSAAANWRSSRRTRGAGVGFQVQHLSGAGLYGRRRLFVSVEHRNARRADQNESRWSSSAVCSSLKPPECPSGLPKLTGKRASSEWHCTYHHPSRRAGLSREGDCPTGRSRSAGGLRPDAEGSLPPI